MSDLQCPAVLVLIPLEALGASPLPLQAMRLAGVFLATVSTDDVQRSAAEKLARDAGCSLEPLPSLRDGASLSAAIEYLGDLYRGETVALIDEAQRIQATLRTASAPQAATVLSVDSSGWTVRP